ncbi:lactaldehyde reductase [Microbacterium shaanxiense]
MTLQFQVQTRIHAGIGAVSGTRSILDRLGAQRVLVVVDRGLEEIGMLTRMLDTGRVGDLVVDTVRIDVNPAPAPVEEAAAGARAADVDVVLGVGGGSALGAAKAIALLQTNRVPILELEGDARARHLPVPTVAIPTTAGSGSEVSNALVLHEPGLVREIVIRGAGYEPVAAILDGTTLRDLPRNPLVFAGLDALTHALESLWARGRSVFTDACAAQAARELFEVLPIAVSGDADGRNSSGENDTALQRLIEASSLANIACGNSGLALVHALSSSPVVELAHGLQNGVLLPHVAHFNRDALDTSTRELVERLPALYEQIGFHARFEEQIADAVAMVQASRGHPFRENNVRDATDEELHALLHAAGADDLARTT